jgi:hypothetical protein
VCGLVRAVIESFPYFARSFFHFDIPDTLEALQNRKGLCLFWRRWHLTVADIKEAQMNLFRIALISFLVSPLSVLAANSINVVIDGQAYSCSEGTGTGNRCECTTTKYNGSQPEAYYQVYKRGTMLYTSGVIGSVESANTQCKTKIVTMPDCYR